MQRKGAIFLLFGLVAVCFYLYVTTVSTDSTAQVLETNSQGLHQNPQDRQPLDYHNKDNLIARADPPQFDSENEVLQPPPSVSKWREKQRPHSSREIQNYNRGLQRHNDVGLLNRTPLDGKKSEISDEDVHGIYQWYDNHIWPLTNFTTDGDDVIVFLHMQKTGGTFFGRNLVLNMELANPCQCSDSQMESLLAEKAKSAKKQRCSCRSRDGSRIWLFSRYSVGWPCGLHADWTELQECVDGKMNDLEGKKRKRRYHYITILRDPTKRYLSEWMHVRRGATWGEAKLKCNGKSATIHQVPFCFTGDSWSGVSLDEFMSCPSNLAHDRQTRMLANLSTVGCYDQRVVPDTKERNRRLLDSAKANLRSMAYVGIMDNADESQFVFQRTFGLQFALSFREQNHKVHAENVISRVTPDQMTRLRKLNDLDIQLYEYAEQLFHARFQTLFNANSGKDGTGAL